MKERYPCLYIQTTGTYNHRTFNNWIKSVLISKYTCKLHEAYREEWGDDDDASGEGQEKLELSVLDIACGKGGDLNKWKFAGTRNYFGVDISLKAVQDANQRKIKSR